MSRFYFTKLRHLAEASVCRICAALCKTAAVLRIDRAWDLAFHYAEYGEYGEYHLEFRASELWRRLVCRDDVDHDEYHAADPDSGAGDRAGG